MTANVTISSIEKHFGATKTLKGVSVDVAAGEFLTLVGPSGCGKSTLLRILAGLVPQDGGSISIDGAPVDHLPPKARDVSMVFQSYALYPHMSVRQNIATPLNIRHLSGLSRMPLVGKLVPGQAQARAEIAQAIEQVAAQVEIEPLLDRRPAQLSGGQRQRVALARAMVRQPRVFLMDEPLSNLDARLRVHMRGELTELHRRLGATFIYVTHDQVEAMTMSSRVALMMEGEIVQVATPHEIYSNPTDVRVARFIGSPEINLLQGRADSQGRVAIGGRQTALRTHAEGQVTVGLRPEILGIDDASSDIAIKARLLRSERLGHDVLLHARNVEGEQGNLILRISSAEMEALQMNGRLNDAITIGARASAALLFGSDGKRVPSVRPAPVAPVAGAGTGARAADGLIMTMSLTQTLDAPLVRGRRLGAQISPSVAYWFALPSVILLAGTLLLPIVTMIAMSFTDYELGALDFSFIGVDNYAALANDKTFWRSLNNTLYYVALVVPTSVIIGLVLAVMVQGLRRGRGFYQVAFFLPVTSTLIAMATVWKYLLHGTIGPVNHLLTAIGLPSLEFFGTPSLVMPALAIIGIWSLAGFNMVLFTSGLTAIPEELYEAASVDGIDSPIERFFTVTMPMLGPTTMFVIITTSITAFKVFDTVAVLTKGGPQGASDVLLYTNYLEGFQYMRIGVASAITVVFLGIILLLSLVQAKVLERKVHY